MEDLVRKRKPDVVRLTDKGKTIDASIEGCIDFTIINAGSETIYYGFSSESKPDIPIEPGESAPWPLYRPCEVWDGKVYIRFEVNGGIALLLKTV
jgi:hypothetical protein